MLSFVYLASAVAFNALISLAVLALDISYAIPIALLLIRKLEGAHPRYGPWKIGRFSIPVNVFALVFLIFSIIWVAFPPFYPITAETMNFAGPITIGIISLALLDWFTGGNKRFVVPKSQYDLGFDDGSEGDATKDSA